MYHAFRNSKSPKFVFDVARRVGKSTIMSLIAVEECVRRPNALVKYGAATQEMVREIVIPIMNWIFSKGCPKDMQPRWVQSDSSYMFQNGAKLKMVGLDLHPDRLRGQAMDLAIVDEAAFVDDLEYMIQSILVPQMQGRKGSRILMGSTPPSTPGHPWTARYVPEAKQNDAYIHRTIMHNPRLSLEEKKFFIDEAGGPESVTNRRENFAEHIIDTSLAIVPEFLEAEPDIVVDCARPPFFDAYVSMDPGFRDLTVALFAYYDFHAGKIVFEDEVSLARANTSDIAMAIKKKEHDLWNGLVRNDGKKHPKLRVSDTEPRLIQDLATNYGLTFVPTQKDEKEVALSHMRTLVHQRKIMIHPRCKVLVAHLKHGIWNRSRKSFERSGDYGHFDAIDAMLYMVRNVFPSHTPFPRFTNGESNSTHFIPEAMTNNLNADKLRAAFKKPTWGTNSWKPTKTNTGPQLLLKKSRTR